MTAYILALGCQICCRPTINMICRSICQLKMWAICLFCVLREMSSLIRVMKMSASCSIWGPSWASFIFENIYFVQFFPFKMVACLTWSQHNSGQRIATRSRSWAVGLHASLRRSARSWCISWVQMSLGSCGNPLGRTQPCAQFYLNLRKLLNIKQMFQIFQRALKCKFPVWCLQYYPKSVQKAQGWFTWSSQILAMFNRNKRVRLGLWLMNVKRANERTHPAPLLVAS